MTVRLSQFPARKRLVAIIALKIVGGKSWVVNVMIALCRGSNPVWLRRLKLRLMFDRSEQHRQVQHRVARAGRVPGDLRARGDWQLHHPDQVERPEASW